MIWQQTDDNCEAHGDTLKCGDGNFRPQLKRPATLIYDLTEPHIRSLKSLGVEATSYEAMLSSVFLARLPPNLRLTVSRRVPASGELKMDKLLTLFEDELVAREYASNPPSHNSGQQHHDRGRHSSELSEGHGQHTFLLSDARESEGGSACCYCQLRHNSKDCTTVTDVGARKQILRSSGRCYNCLRKGHIGRHCRSLSKCQQYKGRHHISICEHHSQSAVPSLVRAADSTKRQT